MSEGTADTEYIMGLYRYVAAVAHGGLALWDKV